MAQWLGRRFPEPKTEGSNPSRDAFGFVKYYIIMTLLKETFREGLEPPISSFVVTRLSHWATGTWFVTEQKRLWFSGRTPRCGRGDPGSIPGGRIFTLTRVVSSVVSIPAFQAGGPGSIPGRRTIF